MWPPRSELGLRPRARAPGARPTAPWPRAFPPVTFKSARLAWATAGPPGTPQRPEGPRCPLPPTPRPAAPSSRSPQAAATRSPTAVLGPPPRPGPPVGRWRSPAVVRLQADAVAVPVHLGARPAGHGALRWPPSAPRPGRSGHGAGPSCRAGAQVGSTAERGRERAARGPRGAGRVNSVELGSGRGGAGRGRGRRERAGERGGRARSPASGPEGAGRGGSEHGRPEAQPAANRRGGRSRGGGGGGPCGPRGGRGGGGGGPGGGGAVAPAANEGEAGPPPGPIPGGLRGRDPMARRGADYLSGGARPHLGPMGARAARLCPATGAPNQPCALAPWRSGLQGPRLPGAAPALRALGSCLKFRPSAQPRLAEWKLQQSVLRRPGNSR